MTPTVASCLPEPGDLPSSTPRQFHPFDTLNTASERFESTKNLSAAELLATFSPRHQTKTPYAQPASPLKYEIKMNTPRRLRPKEEKSYVISDDSAPNTPGGDSPFSTPTAKDKKRKRSRRRTILDYESDEDTEIEEPPKTPTPRISSAGHSLRQHGQLSRSLKAQENADKPRRKRTGHTTSRVSKPRGRKAVPKVDSDAIVPTKTARKEVRDAIAAETAVKRANFFVAKKDYFLPLLPEENSVSKITTQRTESLEETSKTTSIVEYEEFTEQPQG